MINAARIQELRDEVGDDDLEEVIAIFCEEMDEVVASLGTIAPDQLSGRLHFLKGSALNIGLDQMSELCRQSEQQIAGDSHAAIDLKPIQSAYDSAKKELAALF